MRSTADSISCRRNRAWNGRRKSMWTKRRYGAASICATATSRSIVPMSLEEKLEFFQAARQDRLQGDRGRLSGRFRDRVSSFMRTLIEQDMIPDDVTVQVLTQAQRAHHQADIRGGQGRQARECHRAPVQLHLEGTARAGLPQIKGRDQADRCGRREAAAGTERSRRRRIPVRILPGELYRH